MKIRFAGLFVAQVCQKSRSVVVHFVADKMHALRVAAPVRTIGPALNLPAGFDVHVGAGLISAPAPVNGVPLAPVTALMTYAPDPTSRFEVHDAHDDAEFSTDAHSAPDPHNFRSLAWLPNSNQLLGGASIRSNQISATFHLRGGRVDAGWTQLDTWNVSRDGQPFLAKRYFADHLVYERDSPGPTVIKSQCGWLVIPDPKSEITFSNMPMTDGGHASTHRALSAQDPPTPDEVNHYNQYNRVLDTYHYIEFEPSDPVGKSRETSAHVIPTDPDHCFPTSLIDATA